MKLGVDGSGWGGHERGVAVSTRRLWAAMAERSDAPRATVFAGAALAAQLPDTEVIDVGPLGGARRAAWQQAVLPRLVRRHGIELLHCPSYTAPLAAGCRTIVTLHDLIAFSHPRLAGWRNVLHLRAIVGRAVRAARAVCTPTRVVARAAIERFGLDPAKLFVVPWGSDAELVPPAPDAAARLVAERFGIARPFALCCGCVEPKKNLAAAARAAAAAGVLLVIAGPWIAASRGEVPCGDGVRYVGYVAPHELSALYATAGALLALSHVEGFGLPAIEAMRHGCPIVAADTPTAREVCGDAASYGALRDVLREPGYSAELVGRGRERAARFTWRAATAKFLEALDHAAR